MMVLFGWQARADLGQWTEVDVPSREAKFCLHLMNDEMSQCKEMLRAVEFSQAMLHHAVADEKAAAAKANYRAGALRMTSEIKQSRQDLEGARKACLLKSSPNAEAAVKVCERLCSSRGMQPKETDFVRVRCEGDLRHKLAVIEARLKALDTELNNVDAIVNAVSQPDPVPQALPPKPVETESPVVAKAEEAAVVSSSAVIKPAANPKPKAAQGPPNVRSRAAEGATLKLNGPSSQRRK